MESPTKSGSLDSPEQAYVYAALLMKMMTLTRSQSDSIRSPFAASDAAVPQEVPPWPWLASELDKQAELVEFVFAKQEELAREKRGDEAERARDRELVARYSAGQTPSLIQTSLHRHHRTEPL